ncbi:MAG: ABC transporter permease [Parasporobacterium sp.]|nr:ABC transporter permease [Parasporobacterium sp.]
MKRWLETRKLARKGEIRSVGKFSLMVRRFCRNKAAVASLVFILLLILIAVFADVLTPYDYDAQNLSEKLRQPSAAHWFGTDDFGRDILTRVFVGTRVSLLVSILAVGISTVFALVIGSIAGYFGGAVDNVIMRITDIFMALPGMLFAMTVSAALGTGIWNTAIALGFTSIAPIVRQVRASILLLKDQEFIEASKAFGSGNTVIIVRHVIPNAFAPLIVQIALRLGDTIMAISGLSFLGLGVQPPTPEWGNMVSVGKDYMSEFLPLILFPGIFVILTMLAFNLLGDGMRDAMDPRMKR